MMARAIGEHPDADLLYSDEDKLDRHGRRNDPYFKPDFNPALLHGQNVISHLGVYRTSMLRRLGGFRSAFDGSQDYDLALRVAAATKAPIVHVPHVLYHWRLFRGAGTFSSTRLDKAVQAARRAIREQAAGQGENVEVVAGVASYHRVLRPRRQPGRASRSSLRAATTLPGCARASTACCMAPTIPTLRSSSWTMTAPGWRRRNTSPRSPVPPSG